MARQKPMTAEQFLAELARDPQAQKRIEERNAPIRERAKFLLKAEAPLVAALNKAGARINSIDDLINTKDKYLELVPTLLEHLDHDYPPEIREGIARALAVPGARIGWNPLVRKFNEESLRDSSGNPNDVKWALHLALGAAADESVLDELIKMAIDRRSHGENRWLFVHTLARMWDPRAVAALQELRGDPDLQDAFERLDRKQKRRRN
jgi:hypothetical protein